MPKYDRILTRLFRLTIQCPLVHQKTVLCQVCTNVSTSVCTLRPLQITTQMTFVPVRGPNADLLLMTLCLYG